MKIITIFLFSFSILFIFSFQYVSLSLIELSNLKLFYIFTIVEDAYGFKPSNAPESEKDKTGIDDSSTTFLTLTGSNFQDVENGDRLQLREFTLSIWFKTDKQDYLEPATIVNKGGLNDDTPGNNMNYGIWITPEGFLQGGFETKLGTNIFVTSKEKYNYGNWHNAILSNDGLFLRLYVDGAEIAKTSSLGAVPDMTGLQPIRIGANSLDLDKFFTGDIDEVILWDRALSSNEIFNFYNYDELPSNGRIVYLPFS